MKIQQYAITTRKIHAIPYKQTFDFYLDMILNVVDEHLSPSILWHSG